MSRRAHTIRQSNRFRPDISAGYLTADVSARPNVHAVGEVHGEPAQVAIKTIELIEMNRDRRMYEWTGVESIPLDDL